MSQRWEDPSDDPLGMVVEKAYEQRSKGGFVCAGLLPVIFYSSIVIGARF